MRILLSVLALGLTLTGCAASQDPTSAHAELRDTAHTTAEYLADPELMEQTITACSSRNDAQYNERMSHAGCKAVLLAVRSSRKKI